MPPVFNTFNYIRKDRAKRGDLGVLYERILKRNDFTDKTLCVGFAVRKRLARSRLRGGRGRRIFYLRRALNPILAEPFSPNALDTRSAMSTYFDRLHRETMELIMQMDRNHWFVAFGLLVLIGFLCMRGFGSRTSY